MGQLRLNALSRKTATKYCFLYVRESPAMKPFARSPHGKVQKDRQPFVLPARVSPRGHLLPCPFQQKAWMPPHSQHGAYSHHSRQLLPRKVFIQHQQVVAEVEESFAEFSFQGSGAYVIDRAFEDADNAASAWTQPPAQVQSLPCERKTVRPARLPDGNLRAGWRAPPP